MSNAETSNVLELPHLDPRGKTDEQLHRWTGEVYEQALPQLSRSTSHWYYIVLIALLPGLMSAMRLPLNNASAIWGLLSLEYLNVHHWLCLIDLSACTPEPAIMYQPPLNGWLAAMAQHVPTLLPLNRHCLPAYLSLVASVCMIAVVARHYLTPRGMIIAALLLGVSGPLLEDVRTGSSLIPGIFCQLSIWDVLIRSQRPKSKSREKLLIAAAALTGLLFLINSIIALANLIAVLTWLVLSNFAISEPTPAATSPSVAADRPRRPPVRKSHWQYLPLCAFAFLLAGAWWPMFMYASHGGNFIIETLGWPSEFAPWYVDMRGSAWEDLAQGGAILSIYSIKLMIGAALCALVGATEVAELKDKQRALRMVTGSMLFGVLGTWAICGEMDITLKADYPFWSVLVTPPLVLLATAAIDVYCRKGPVSRFSNPLLWSALAIFFWGVLPDDFASWLPIVTLLVATFLLTILIRYHEGRGSFLKSTMVVLMLVLSVWTPFPRQAPAKETAINWFQITRQTEKVTWSRLLVNDPPPPRLLYALHRLWPSTGFEMLDQQRFPTSFKGTDDFPEGDGVIVFWGVEPYLPTDEEQRWKYHLITQPQYYAGAELFFYRVSRIPKTIGLAVKGANEAVDAAFSTPLTAPAGSQPVKNPAAAATPAAQPAEKAANLPPPK